MTPDAFSVLSGDPASPVFVTCEHASRLFPDPWRLPASDSWLADTHWAYDLGAETLARGVAARFGAVTILSRFSRLIIDPNRPEADPELIRQIAEGRAIAMNQAVSVSDRERRLALWRAYHDAVDARLAASTASVVLSVHTFTPVYEGSVRRLEVGVLYDRDEALGRALCSALRLAGFGADENEPYSGKLGLMYTAQRHAARHGRQAVEIEVRQDLALDGAFCARLIEVLARTLSEPAR